jgi:coenzyme F420-0:L-glutamate ligase / coenzyme F420-1:gamma-L-glutamate ligase
MPEKVAEPGIEKYDTLVSLLQSRRSIRRYQAAAVPRPVLEQLLAAATWAPSAHNRQPWRFAVITAAETRHRLAEAMGRRLRADLAADRASPAAIERDVGRSYQRITQAPALILVCLTMAEMDNYPDPPRQEKEWLMAVQSTAMAGQNLLLTAHALGLGACWLCAPLFCPDTVRKTLDLPQDWQPQGLITVGYPSDQKEGIRFPLAGRAIFLDG